MRTDPTLWLIARSSGLTAFCLLTASVLAGLLLTGRPFGARLRPATVTEIHRTLALSGLVMLVLHGVSLVLDRAVDIRMTDLLVPGLAPYRPVWTGLGVVAGWLIAILVASFPLRRRIGVHRWRSLHRVSLATWCLALIHTVGSGTDAGRFWVRILLVASVGAIGTAATWRRLAGRPPSRRVAPTGRRTAERSG